MSDAMTLGFLNIGNIIDVQNDDDQLKSTMWNLPSTLSSSVSGLSSALESDQVGGSRQWLMTLLISVL